LLSLLSALVVVSAAFAGISIYVQTDDSELTTFEEEAIAEGEEFEDTMNATDDGGDAMTTPAPGNTTSTNATSTNSTSNATMQ